MGKRFSVNRALRVAFEIGGQVDIELKSGVKLEGVIVEKLGRTSFRVWLEPGEPLQGSEDIDKAIVAKHAVKSVEFPRDIATGSDA